MTLLAAGRSALLATWPAISLFVARRTTLFNARRVRARVADFIALLALPRITSLVESLLAMITARRGRRRIAAIALRPALRHIALLLTGRVMKCSTELAKLLAQRSATLLVTSPTAPLRTRRVIRFIAGFTAPFVTRASVLFATFSTCTAPFRRHLSRRRARPPTRVTRLIGFRILRWAAHRVAGVGRLAGRRRFLVRPSGTFGYIRHGGAL
ncbi:hypothetical protein [Paraburkholderia sp. UCT2]|uniref:hypothetical protein n=1 Tax=Paraburkholderia sp. UCT2 TaxID=2615208 RepID=UPI00223A730A|nr:hypothetical protein [Paraburkholderia sp. UCT2]